MSRLASSFARLSKRQAGDTIVEVLISIAIISSVLVGAYVATNRNTATLQATQEREQAQRLVEAQIEYLANATTTTAAIDCFTPGTGTDKGSSCTGVKTPGSGASYTILIASPGNSGSLPSACRGASTGATAYAICVYWTSLTAQSNDDSNVTMYYRLN